MKLFLTSLATRLDVDRPGWREDTVVLLDGALYHINPEIQEHLRCLQMPVLYTAPKAYDASPIELFWAYLKNQDLNKMALATGKK